MQGSLGCEWPLASRRLLTVYDGADVLVAQRKISRKDARRFFDGSMRSERLKTTADDLIPQSPFHGAYHARIAEHLQYVTRLVFGIHDSRVFKIAGWTIQKGLRVTRRVTVCRCANAPPERTDQESRLLLCGGKVHDLLAVSQVQTSG